MTTPEQARTCSAGACVTVAASPAAEQTEVRITVWVANSGRLADVARRITVLVASALALHGAEPVRWLLHVLSSTAG